jgi:hypothetical protein
VSPSPQVSTYLDSYYVPNYVASLGLDTSAIQEEIETHGLFIPRSNKEMMYRGSVLKREKFFLVDSPQVDCDGNPLQLYKYKYPSFQWSSMEHYRSFESMPLIHKLIQRLCQKLGVVINHVIGTRYELETDEIGYHSDEMTDITPDTPILTVSFGDVREIHLCECGWCAVCLLLVLCSRSCCCCCCRC